MPTMPTMPSIATLATLALANVAAALPANGFTPLTKVSHVAKFEDEAAGLALGLPVRGLTALGTYENLYYKGLGVVNAVPLVAGVTGKSPPNAIAYDIVSSTTSSGDGGPNISADYPGSQTDHFAFKQFYFGCGLDLQESLTTAPVTCTITITGFRHGAQVASQQATFTAGGLVRPMTEVNLASGFADVDKVTFATVSSLTSLLITPILDNLAYDVYLTQ